MRRNPVHTAQLEAEMIKQIRMSAGISRADLARRLSLSGSTAGVYVERLIANGLLTESAATSRETGRPPKLLQLNPRGGEFIGVDFEARNIMAIAIDFAEKPLRRAHQFIAGTESAGEIVRKIQRAVMDVLPPDTSHLFGIGIGVPGIVDAMAGIAVKYEHLPQWKDVPLVSTFERHFKVPVYLENTMRAMALAELWFGHGRGVQDFACICIRSGMGAGIVLNGQLVRGAHHFAGELGLAPCPPLNVEEAAYFMSGSRPPREVQQIVSEQALRTAVQRLARSGRSEVLSRSGRAVTFEDIRRAAEQQDPGTLAVLKCMGRTLAAALANLTLTADPAKLILVGNLTSLGDAFLQPLRDGIASALRPLEVPVPAIVNSALGEYVGALGAAALALHEWTPISAVRNGDA